MTTFNFTVLQPRVIDLDKVDGTQYGALLEKVPSYRRCIGCGGCAATCTAGSLTSFDIRKIHTLFSRGQYDGLDAQLNACMLCGKCVLVCPRGVNTRLLIVQMRKMLAVADSPKTL